jgi:SAM-dependent MidA family methyltransferase
VAGRGGRRAATISRAAGTLVLTPDGLPPLEPEEARRSAELAARIRGRIAAQGGWLPFSEFMQAALYEPELGYYMAGGAIFGGVGDFVTAPELSPLFAGCLAGAVDALLAAADGDDVVEFGAGSGRLAAELVAALARRGRAPRRYRIVEPSGPLRDRQRSLLERAPRGMTAFEWLDAPPPGAWAGVAIANEVVDALPVDRFRVTREGCEAIGVAAGDGAFRWRARTASPELASAVAALQQHLPAALPAGYESELRLGEAEWLQEATATLTRGALLVIDYGLPRVHYYHASRDGGTLCGFRRHRRVEDPLAAPGAQDLTAWVDFSLLADEARGAGLELAAFATQAHFLLETGIDQELARLVEAAPEGERAAHRQVAATLLLPGEMGERFKVMALARGIRGPFHGFGFRDLGASL